MAPRSRRILGLSLAFQAQSLALAHPCHARFGAANASERPWAFAKMSGAATVRERLIPLKSPVLPQPTAHPRRSKPVGFLPRGHGATAAPHTWPVTSVPGSVPCSRTPWPCPIRSRDRQGAAMAYGQACAPPKGMNAGGFSTGRSRDRRPIIHRELCNRAPARRGRRRWTRRTEIPCETGCQGYHCRHHFSDFSVSFLETCSAVR